MKDKNQYLLKKISLLYIVLIPIYYLLVYKFYDGNITFICSLIILIVLSGFNNMMSYIKNPMVLNLIFSILYGILFICLSYIIFIYADSFDIDHLLTCIILILSIICPFLVYWYLKKKGIFISIFILSFNFLVVTWPVCFILMLHIEYG